LRKRSAPNCLEKPCENNASITILKSFTGGKKKKKEQKQAHSQSTTKGKREREKEGLGLSVEGDKKTVT